MISIRFYHGSFWNPLHLLIMAVTRSRVVHCDVLFVFDFLSFDEDGNDIKLFGELAIESYLPVGVTYSNQHVTGDVLFEFNGDMPDIDEVIGTPYDYRAALAYVWPWVRESKTRMNCVEVCLWAMRKAGIPTPRNLPTPGGLERWCRKLKVIERQEDESFARRTAMVQKEMK